MQNHLAVRGQQKGAIISKTISCSQKFIAISKQLIDSMLFVLAQKIGCQKYFSQLHGIFLINFMFFKMLNPKMTSCFLNKLIFSPKEDIKFTVTKYSCCGKKNEHFVANNFA